ncbi:MAG: 4-hydroxythreonine-4-phosphate dehydrogenase PdxA [Acidobacteriota bacterium]|jgi:4-hydroxythreonine-4-phosphate dehydrogenase
MSRPRLAVSMGDPAGIGPEIVLRAGRALIESGTAEPVVFGDDEYLRAVAEQLGVAPLPQVTVCATVQPGMEPGRPRRADAAVALACIAAAADAAQGGGCAALVTAPVSKEGIAHIEPSFRGHTEFLAARAGVRDPLMLFAGIEPAVALLTTHLPLASALAAVRRPRVIATLRRLDEGWSRWFGARPCIGVAGLNPHAGEHGLLGYEDDVEVRPGVVDARREGIDARGPYPADSILRHRELDVILALYHDQGTIMAKNAATPSVNTTLGLPYPRTSPDHGVAYDIAGKGTADSAAMLAALRLAAKMAARR